MWIGVRLPGLTSSGSVRRYPRRVPIGLQWLRLVRAVVTCPRDIQPTAQGHQGSSDSCLRNIIATTNHPSQEPQSMVAADASRAASQDQELVADELATQVDKDRRPAGQARAVLLAAAGRGVSEPQAVH